jgi:hypothetical protein
VGAVHSIKSGGDDRIQTTGHVRFALKADMAGRFRGTRRAGLLEAFWLQSQNGETPVTVVAPLASSNSRRVAHTWHAANPFVWNYPIAYALAGRRFENKKTAGHRTLRQNLTT